jgi:hypothetical protein
VRGEQIATLQCTCGYAILCELRRLGEGLGTPVFFDDEPTSATHGQRVKSCPGCGEQLEFLKLWLKYLRR